MTLKRICPKCGRKKAYYAKACRGCSEPSRANLGLKGPAHPAWKGGIEVDRDGYMRRYAPDHPWPRKNGYVREHVRVMELSLQRRILPTEVVHHIDGNITNNALENLEVIEAGEHARRHRKADCHRRKRDSAGRFA